MQFDREKLLEIAFNKYFSSRTREKYKRIVKNSAINLCDKTFEKVGLPYWFTNHGPEHSDAVLYYSLSFADRASEILGKLTHKEMLTLICSCYLHDLSMAYIPINYNLSNGWTQDLINEIRHKHVIDVVNIIANNNQVFSELYNDFPDLETIIPLVCKAHGTDYHDEACNELREFSKRNLRGELLGKILLLSDEMDISHHRAYLDHPQLDQFPIISKTHHYKHYYIISSIPDLPMLKIQFSFNTQTPEITKYNFVEWVSYKLRTQQEKFLNNVPAEYKDVLKFDITVDPRYSVATRDDCPDEVHNHLKDIMKTIKQEIKDNSIYEKTYSFARPNQYHPLKTSGRKLGPLFPIIDHLMNYYFKTLNNEVTINKIKSMYIKVKENEDIIEYLSKNIDSYISNYLYADKKIPSYNQPFVITGGLGAGKSSLIYYLIGTNILHTQINNQYNDKIIAYIDCISLDSDQDLLRKILNSIFYEIKNEPILEEIFIKYELMKDDHEIAFMEYKEMLNYYRGITELFNSGIYIEDVKRKIPLIIIIDNLDKVPGYIYKNNILYFICMEAIKNYPYYVVTSRYNTKHLFDKENDHIPDLATFSIKSISLPILLKNRMDHAFHSTEITEEEGWYKKYKVETKLGYYRIQFNDFKEALDNAIYSLTGHTEDTERQHLVPSLSGSNLRRALTLFRAIIKSINIEEFIKLSYGALRGHYLISCLMKETFPYYVEKRSKIRNLFSNENTENYFGILYMLYTLYYLQLGEDGDDNGFSEIIMKMIYYVNAI